MKISIECKNIIDELCKKIGKYGCGEQCYLAHRGNDNYFYSYFIPNELNNAEDFKKFEECDVFECSLFQALVIFVSQDSFMWRTHAAYTLKACRCLKNMPQSTFAKELGVLQNNYAKWESGERTPKIDLWIKVSKLCNIPLSNLVELLPQWVFLTELPDTQEEADEIAKSFERTTINRLQ